MEALRLAIDQHYQAKPPSQIVFEVVGTILLIWIGKIIIWNGSEIKDKVISTVFKGLKTLPAVQGQVKKEKDKIKAQVANKLALKTPPVLDFPEKGIPHEEIVTKMHELRENDQAKYKIKKISGVVYGGEEKHTELMNKVYSLYSLSNALHPDVYPSVRKYEAEIIRMTANMLNGDQDVCGALTSGGTESILMAVKAHRDYFNKPNPEIIVPVTAHAAFDKAGAYFKVKVVHIPVGKDGTVDPKAVEAAINRNTILLVGSAPEYAHGIIDPIPQLAAIAQKHGLGFHTDCCLGGYILPWVQKSGVDGGKIPLFDFRVPGVTSMSCDTHKYGYTTKGTSVVLFRNEEWRRPMFFVQPNWPGGMYASPTIAGSRSGGVIACCWASLLAVGKEGFMSKSVGIWKAAQKIKEGIKKIPDLHLVGDSVSMVIACGSSTLNIFKVGDAMSSKGWHLNMLQSPAALHICCTPNHIGMEDQFLVDLADATAYVKSNPEAFPDGMAPIYGMAASFPDRATVAEIGLAYLEAVLQTQEK